MLRSWFLYKVQKTKTVMNSKHNLFQFGIWRLASVSAPSAIATQCWQLHFPLRSALLGVRVAVSKCGSYQQANSSRWCLVNRDFFLTVTMQLNTSIRSLVFLHMYENVMCCSVSGYAQSWIKIERKKKKKKEKKLWSSSRGLSLTCCYF